MGILFVIMLLGWMADSARAQGPDHQALQEATTSPDESLLSTIEASPTITATATLLPLPTVTFLYPPTATPTDVLLLAERPPGEPALNRPRNLFWQKLARLWPLGILLGIWAFLGAWLIFTRRSSE
ncbi:MAG: hypothetical protein AB1894_21675 [Chloroflexota bacterium]